MSKFWSLLEDNSGGLSAMRVAFLTVVLVTMFNWTFTCINKKELVPMDTNMVTLVIGLGGVKAVQRFGEKPADSTTPPTTTS